jgi:hypothetical protein
MSDTPKPPDVSAFHLFGQEAMNESEWLSIQEFAPNRLLDALIKKMRLENDTALASRLAVIEPIIAMVRDGSLTVTPAFLFAWIREATGLPSSELHALMRQGGRKP